VLILRGKCVGASRLRGGALLLLALLSVSGCFGPRKGVAPQPPDLWKPPATDNSGSAASAVFPPVIPIPEETAPAIPAESPPAEPVARAPEKEEAAAPAPPETGDKAVAPAPPPAEGGSGGDRLEDATEKSRAPAVPVDAGSREPSPREVPVRHPAPPGTAPQAKTAKTAPPPEPVSPPREAPQAAPAWTRQKEVLVYRVDFIGITMGYARFIYRGKVSIGGKIAYHLNVRAWTSGILSYIYPINETIDYYLDAETLAPVRQEFTERERDKDDVAIYDQETGKIIYRYRQSGEIRKQVETVPDVYDPVSAAYYFRWKDVGGEERPRNVYAGRKVYQISARLLGTERLQTEHGVVDTLVIQPVIRREGKVEDKGDLKMWISNDERRVPVRLYAKFRKIKDWTLVGELVPAQKRG
jgi:hypothetical protein